MKPFKKILVIGIVSNEDSTLKEQMEDHLTNDLKASGYNAISFTKEFDRTEFSKDMSYDLARQKIMAKGIDAVITISLLSKAREQVYVEEKNTNVIPKDRNSFWNYYQSTMNAINKKGYYVTTTKYFWESNLWDLEKLTMIYSSKTTSFDPLSARKMAHEYGKLILQDLQKNYIITAKPVLP